MGLVAPVVNGEIQEVSNSDDSLTSGSGAKSSLDKDAFLQLLVAQMKYQDPLEPTSNTEFISQFATFTELEEMQNMRLSMDLQRAQGLVGQEVIVKKSNSRTGTTGYKAGVVDYVLVENGKAYLSIEDERYPLDDLDTVVDKNYKAAYDKASKFVNAVGKLPATSLLTTESMDEVFELKETYDSMTDYEKSFIAEDVTKILDKVVAKMKELMTLEGLTYEKKEVPTTEDLLQDLLDKIDKIIGEMGNIGNGTENGGTGGVNQPNGGEGDADKPEENGGTGDVDKPEENGGTGDVDKPEENGGTGDTDKPGSGATDETDKPDGGDADNA